jgi:hypothetical protein
VLNLEVLTKNDPMAVFDLVMKARDNNYQFFGDAEMRLQEHGLVEKNGQIHESIKNIVLSAFEGEGIDIVFVNPVVKEQ